MGREDVVHAVKQDHRIKLQTLGRVGGGQGQPCLRALGVLHYNLVQLVDSIQKLLDGAHPGGKAHQNVKLLRLHRVARPAGEFQIAEISDLIEDALHRLDRIHLVQLLDHHRNIPDFSGVLVFVAQRHHPVEIALSLHQRTLRDAAEHVALQARGGLVKDAGKGRKILRVKAERKEGQYVRNDIVVFQPCLVLLDVKIHIVAVQNVRDGDSRQVVAVDEGGRSRLCQVRFNRRMVLVGKIVQFFYLDWPSPLVVGEHVFGVALLVKGDKAVGVLHNLPGTAEIFLHLQQLCLWILLWKFQQVFRAGPPKAVDALVLIPHQKKILAFLSQQADHSVLQLGGVLRLVHAEIGVAILIVFQNLRVFFEDGQGIAEHIVKIHQTVVPLKVTVGLVDAPQIFDLGLQNPLFRRLFLVLLDILLPQHRVLDKAQVGDQLLLQILRQKLLIDVLINLPQGGAALPCLNQPGSDASGRLAVAADHLIAEGMDGAEKGRLLFQLPKQPLIAPAHVPCSCFGEGDGQNRGRRNAVLIDHAGNPADHHRRLARSGNGQQQHRAVDGLDGLKLLLCKTQMKLFL